MIDDLRLRRCWADDVEAILELDGWALREAGTDPTDVPGSGDLRELPASYLEAGGAFVAGTLPEAADARLPALADGHLIAAGGFRPTDAGYEDERVVEGAAELHRMRVAPPHQGRGYGRELLSELERRALSAGFRPLLATTAARQRSAVEFYPAAGYREVGRSTYGEYELVHFQKEL
ncbi:N-acetyltransferase [Halobacteriales archaeon SW_5_68_122]|nr:MAG: N-acetyltransferase [Halobacteriales archaeon SW_5_68_122]